MRWFYNTSKSNFNCSSLRHEVIIILSFPLYYRTYCRFSTKANTLKILAGTGNKLDLKKVNKNVFQERGVSKIIKHPEYYSGGLYNDAALLILTEALPVETQLNTICLPEHDSVFDGAKCWAAGWGNTGAILDGEMLKFYASII